MLKCTSTQIKKLCLYTTIFAAFLTLFSLSSSAHAATKYWIGSGADTFSDNTKWSTSSGGANNTTAPSAADVATFDSNSGDCTISATASISSLDIKSTYAGSITASSSVTLNIASTLTLAGGTLNLAAADLNVDGGYTISGGTFNPPTATAGNGGLYFGGGTLTDNNGTNYSDTNLILDSGDFYLSSSLTFKTLTQNGNDLAMINPSVGKTLTITGLATLSNGRLVGSGVLDLQGDVTIDANWDGAGGSSMGYLKFSSSASPTISLTLLNNSRYYPYITLNSAGTTLTVPSSASAHTFSGITLTTGTLNMANSMTMANAFSIAAGTLDFTGTSKTYTFSSTFTSSGGTVQSTGTGNTVRIDNTYSQSTGTVNFSNITFDMNYNITVSSGTFNPPTNAAGTGDFYFSGGTLTDNNGSDYSDTDLILDAGDTYYASSLTFKTLTQNGNDMAVINPSNTKTLTITGQATLSNGRLVGSGVLDLQGDVTIDANWDGAGSSSMGYLKFSSSSTPSISLPLLNNSRYYPYITLNSAGTTLTVGTAADGSAQNFSGITLTTGSINMANSITMANAFSIAGGTLDFTGTSKTYTFSSTFTSSGGTVQSTGTGNTVRIDNTYSQSTGTVNFSNITFDMNYNITVSSGTFNPPTNAAGTGDFYFSGGTLTDNNGSDYSNTDLILDSSDTVYASSLTFKTLTQNGNDLAVINPSVTKTLTITGQATLSNGRLVGSGVLNLQGPVTIGANWDGSGSSAMGYLSFTSSSAQTISLPVLSSSRWYPYITLNSSGTTLQGPSSGTLLFSGISSFAAGTLDLNGANLTSNSGSSTFTVASGATLALNGGETLTLSANPTFSSGSIVKYNGTGASYTIKNWTYSNATLEIAGGASSIFSQGANTTVNNLTLTSGIYYLAGYNLTVSSTYSNNSTLALQGGETTVSLTQDTDSGTTEYTGTTSYSSLKLGNNYYSLKINGSGGSFRHSGTLDVNGDLTIATGTLDSNGQNITLAGNWTNGDTYTSGSNTVTLDGTGAQTIVTGGTGTTQDFNNFTLNKASGTATLSTNAIDIDGNFTLTAGTLDANGQNMTVSGNWANGGGTFTHGNGTVNLGTGSQSVSGSTTFYNLTKQVSSAATLTLTAGTTQTVAGTLTMNGASGQLLTVASSAASAATINPAASTVSYLDVSYNTNSSGSDVNCWTGCNDGGNNNGWSFSNTTVGFTAASQSSASEAGNMVITAQLSGVAAQDVTVPYTVTGTATGGGTDYSITASPITITAGNTTGTITINITSDTLDEADETVIVTMGTPTNATASGTTVHTATITDDDNAPTLSIDDVSNAESSNAQFTVTLSAASGKTITVDYASSNGTATAGTDYTATSGTLTFSAGETTKNINVTVSDDGVDEDDETINMGLSNATNASISDNTGVATITDNDTAPNVTLSVDSNTLAENAAVSTMTATLSAISGRDVVVNLAYSGTATNITDYTRSSSSITISAGSLTNTATVTTVDDSIDETNETIIVDISSVDNSAATEATPQQETITITDDDAAPTLSINDVSNAESANAQFTVTLSAVSGKTVTVDYASSNGTASSGSDYSSSSGTLTFNAGETTKNIDVTVSDDSLDEADETFNMGLSNASNASISDSSGVATITDNDGAPQVQWTTTSQSSADETDTSTLTVTAQLSAVSGKDVTVPFTVTGTATGGGTDYTITASPITISAGQSSNDVTITLVGDDSDEGDETVILTLDAPTNATVGVNNVHTATITDDDNAAVLITESGGTTNITEGSSTDTYTVVLQTQPTADVEVTVTPNAQQSVSGSTLVSNVLTFTTANWNVAQTITVTAVDDLISESTHAGSITHTASSADASYNGITINSVTPQITDNDSAGVSITQSGGSTAVSESGSTDSYTVVLTSEPTSDIKVLVSSADTTYGVTVSGSTLSVSKELTFSSANWNIPQTITVTAVNDSKVEDTHTKLINHTLSQYDAAYTGVTISSVSVSISDNDSAGVTFSKSSLTVSESGTTDSYTAVLNGMPSSSVTVTINAISRLSITPSTKTLTFTTANWNTPQTVSVAAVNDNIQQGSSSETITHTSSSSDTYFNALTLSSVSVAIGDNDSSAITPSVSSLRINEGESGSYTVVLATQPSADVVITPRPGTGLSVSPSGLVFSTSNWNTPQTLTVTPDDDEVKNENRSVRVAYEISSSDTNYAALTPTALLVNVIEDDEDPNLAVEIGSNFSMRRRSTAPMSATVTPTGTQVTYLWQIISGAGSLAAETDNRARYTASDVSGLNTVRVTVVDSQGRSATDEVVITVFGEDTVTVQAAPERVVAQTAGRTIVEDRTASTNQLQLIVENAEIDMPEEATQEEGYSMAFTDDGRLIIGVPGEENGAGRVYFGRTPVDQMGRNNLRVASLRASRSLSLSGNLGSPSEIAQYNQGDFAVSTGASDNAGFGAFITTGDIDNDGVSEIFIAAPNHGDYGIIYVYNTDYDLIATITGSEDHPAGAMLVGEYLLENNAVLFGPNNSSMNINLSRPTSIGTVSSALLIAADDNFGDIDLSDTELGAALGDINVFRSSSASGYVNTQFADLNGDDIQDLILADNLGNIYAFYGPIEENSDLSTSSASFRILGAESDIGFGEALAIGDVSGDDVPDLIIGAPRFGSNQGAVCIVFGPFDNILDIVESSSAYWVLGDVDDALGADFALASREGESGMDIYTLKGSRNEVVKIAMANITTDTPSDGSDVNGQSYVSGGGCGLNSSLLSAEQIKVQSLLQLLSLCAILFAVKLRKKFYLKK